LKELETMNLNPDWFIDKGLQKRYLDTFHLIGVDYGVRLVGQLGTELVAKVKQQQKEIDRLERFIENLQDVHELEKARLRAEIGK